MSETSQVAGFDATERQHPFVLSVVLSHIIEETHFSHTKKALILVAAL